MKRGIVGVGAAAMLLLGAPVAAHAEDAPPVDPPTTAPPPVVLPPISSDPIVLPPPETPTGVFIPPPPTDGGQQAEPPSAVFVPPPPLVLTEAQTIALVAAANSGSGQWDIQFDDNGTLQMRPFGSSEPWMQVGPTGMKRLSAPAPGTVKMMWDVDALFADHQLKRIDPIGKKLSSH